MALIKPKTAPKNTMNDQANNAPCPEPTRPGSPQETSGNYQRLSSKVVSSIKKLGFLLAPGHCVLCQLPTKTTRDLCIYCKNSLPWLNHQCPRCALVCGANHQDSDQIFSETDTKLFSGMRINNGTFTPPTADFAQTQLLCSKCSQGTHFTDISATVAPLAYQGCARWLVTQQKHRKGCVQGRVLAELLADVVRNKYQTDPCPNLPDLLIPVPLHWRRQWVRGHNQSALLARHLGGELAIPVTESLVARRRATAAQQSLGARARARNVAGIFATTQAASAVLSSLANGRVAIVDDVVTTGATAISLARTLHAAGAKEIHLWSPARAILNV